MPQQSEVRGVKTAIFTEDGWTRVVYHKTVVVKFNQDEIVLDSGRWKTFTTKTRMNQAGNQFELGYWVYAKDFEWFVDFNGKTCAFEDGMILKRN